MTRLACPLCGKKVDATPTGWARHLVLKCKEADVYDEKSGAVRCPCGSMTGYLPDDVDWDGDMIVSLLADHFFAVKYKSEVPGRKFNLTEHLVSKWVLYDVSNLWESF